MKNIFELAESCLFTSDIESKLRVTSVAQSLAEADELSFCEYDPPRPISETLFPDKPILLMPRDMPKRRLDTKDGKAAFFHALAHIEFMAIYLAWDIIYRFRGLPENFYRDWLRIAHEEALHYSMICQHLLNFDIGYGDLPAHRGLWSHAEETEHDILARLAVVPRCMEARGLDVTPGMISKLQSMGDLSGATVLQRIFEDEIGHVERGSYWFDQFARARGGDPEQMFKSSILACYKGKPKGPFNREVRIIAGFTDNELDWLEGNA